MIHSRHFFRVIGCLVVLAIISTKSRADMVATDSFNYPDGQTLYGQNGGTGWTTIWTGSGMMTQTGQAVSAVNGNPYGSRNFENPAFSDPGLEWLFISIQLTTPTFGIDDFFIISTGTGVNNNQIAFGKRPGSNFFEVGLGGWTASNISILPNTTTHLIGAYRLQPSLQDYLYLWVNPNGADFLDPLTGESSADAFNADFFVFPAGYATIYTNRSGAAFDNLVISNSPGGVGLASSAVPEPACLPLLLTSLGLTMRSRRCRKATLNG